MCRLVNCLLLVVTAVTRRVPLIGMQLSEPLQAYNCQALSPHKKVAAYKWYSRSVKMS